MFITVPPNYRRTGVIININRYFLYTSNNITRERNEECIIYNNGHPGKYRACPCGSSDHRCYRCRMAYVQASQKFEEVVMAAIAFNRMLACESVQMKSLIDVD